MCAKFVQINKILQQYDFSAEAESNKDFTCVICGRLLRNAYSGPCGCRYCFDCITQYLNDGQKCCPGSFDDCKEQEISLYDNLFVDQAANSRLARLIVKCPDINCDFRDELKRIEEHICVCRVQSKNCPYYELGCAEINISRNKMNEHLSEENYSHTVLIMDWMRNVKNDVDSVEERMKGLIVSVNEKLQSVEERLGTMRRRLQRNETEMRDMREKMDRVIRRQNDKKRDNCDSDQSDRSTISLFDTTPNPISNSLSSSRSSIFETGRFYRGRRDRGRFNHGFRRSRGCPENVRSSSNSRRMHRTESP